ncbi:MAG: hypothetical protein KGQ59_02715 [Bdellovibrionales bacterium]|nr:hypothetical protein [Bdellovibrionales bacterium]
MRIIEVDMSKYIAGKLAPAPVTRAEYRVHWAVVAAFFGLWSLYFGVKSLLTPIQVEFMGILATSVVTTFWVWLAASASSAFLRLQTQTFRLTATFIAASFGTIGFFLVNDLSPIFYFYFRPRWLASLVVVVLHCVVGFYWAFWFAKRALPTTVISMVRRVVATVLGFLMFSLMVLSSATRNSPRELQESQIIPFAAQSGAQIDLQSQLDGHFKKVNASAMSERKR